MEYNQKPNESFFEWKLRLVLGKVNKEHDLDWTDIVNTLGLNVHYDTLRKSAPGIVETHDYYQAKLQTLLCEQGIEICEVPSSYNETIEIQKDGSHRSNKLIEMSEAQSKDPEFLLKAHGYDPNEWEITSAKSSMWNQHNKTDKTIILYSSKITVKPKTDCGFSKLIETIENQEPIIYNPSKRALKQKYMLEVAPVDTHFGISSLDYYKPNQENIINKIQSRYWEEIVIPVGNDLFHNDDFRGRTSSGREIQKVDMKDAWKDAWEFYYPIISEAINNSNKTKIIYVKGNHDESMSWGFVKNLETKFPEIEVDDDFKEHKVHIFYDVFLGYTHGDKNRNNTAKIFNSKFRMEIAKAKVREIHIAHLHGEDANTKDDYGIMIRTLPTMNKEDEWHDDNGYVGRNKRFQLFEYSESEIKGFSYA